MCGFQSESEQPTTNRTQVEAKQTNRTKRFNDLSVDLTMKVKVSSRRKNQRQPSICYSLQPRGGLRDFSEDLFLPLEREGTRGMELALNVSKATSSKWGVKIKQKREATNVLWWWQTDTRLVQSHILKASLCNCWVHMS